MTTPAFLLCGGAAAAIAFLTMRAVRTEDEGRRFAHVFWIATATLSAAAFLASTGRSLKLLPSGFPPPLASALLGYRLFIPFGVAIAACALIPLALRRPALGALVFSPRVRGALRLSIVLAYAGIEIGKLTHAAEMRDFFVSSGLPAWTNSAVIAAETALAVALFWSAAEIAAAAGLSFILAGAIATHAHNGDPFSDSLDAVHLLVLLAGFALLQVVPRRHRLAGLEVLAK